MNHKSIGEKGQNCVIGELAKWDIPVGVMLSDNLPFELIAYLNNKLYRIQVKTSGQGDESVVKFDFSSNNWHQKTTKLYTKADCDVIVGYDINRHNVYLFSADDFDGRRWFNIRIEPPKNNQTKGINLHENFVISEKRIAEVFI